MSKLEKIIRIAKFACECLAALGCIALGVIKTKELLKSPDEFIDFK